MKNVKLLLCVFIALFAACSKDDNITNDSNSQTIQSMEIFSGTWIADSLRYSHGSEGQR